MKNQQPCLPPQVWKAETPEHPQPHSDLPQPQAHLMTTRIGLVPYKGYGFEKRWPRQQPLHFRTKSQFREVVIRTQFGLSPENCVSGTGPAITAN